MKRIGIACYTFIPSTKGLLCPPFIQLFFKLPQATGHIKGLDMLHFWIKPKLSTSLLTIQCFVASLLFCCSNNLRLSQGRRPNVWWDDDAGYSLKLTSDVDPLLHQILRPRRSDMWLPKTTPVHERMEPPGRLSRRNGKSPLGRNETQPPLSNLTADSPQDTQSLSA